MTGMGAAARTAGGLSADVEIRSVNQRFLKVQLRLPAVLEAVEPEMEARVRGRVRRGAVTVTVRVAGVTEAPFAVSEAGVRAHLEGVRAVAERLGIRMEADRQLLETVIRLPGAVESAETGEAMSEPLRSLVLEACDGALEQLDAMRSREGASLGGELLRLSGEARRLSRTVADRAPDVVRGHRARLAERVNALLAEGAARTAVTEADLAREVALFADRADITEELHRLGCHLDRLEETVRGEGEAGRRLEFLLQEIVREVNTIGSKANDTAIAHAVIELKCIAEQLREQVQNVE